MPATADDTDDGSAPTDGVHDTSWSATLEEPRHADDESLVCEEAVDAVERTAEGVHVNLVTHGDLGHPETYPSPALAARFGDAVEGAFVDRCGCGGYVTRVTT